MATTGRSQRHLRDTQGVDSTGDTSGRTNNPVAVEYPQIVGTPRVGSLLQSYDPTFKGQPPFPLINMAAFMYT